MSQKNLPLVTNIQKYSIHDGKGIRTTVFFKGCPLSCRWCHNPETQSFSRSLLFYRDRCRGCGMCARVCPHGAVSMKEGRPELLETLCQTCGVCVEECLFNARELCGRFYSVDELTEEIRKDQAFYETSGGGVTFSGGEVLAQDGDYLEELLRRLVRYGISVYMDTCGDVPWGNIRRVLPYTDTFLYDLKLIREEEHRIFTGKTNRRILENLRRLSAAGGRIWIRIPVIGGVNDRPETIEEMGRWLLENQISVSQISLLPYHNTGSGKYAQMNKIYPGEEFYTPGEEKMEQLARILREQNRTGVSIGG
ncbi:MAG: glycyl-radical enzyme activating protein [Clostridiales bacterium]|nr:glycyl-radical enzyme activating protein [Clostridiales bacterium]